MTKLMIAGLLLLLAFPAKADHLWYPGNSQIKAYTASDAVIDNGMGTRTSVVRLVCSTDCFVAFAISGQTPDASATTGIFLTQDEPHFFRIGAGEKIAVVRDAGNGTLYVTEFTK